MTERLIFGSCSLGKDGLLETPAGSQQLSRRHTKILRALVEARRVAVSSEELLDLCWGVGLGSPQNLAKAVFQIRTVLANTPGVRIESVYGYGYRLTLSEKDREGTDVAAIANAICDQAQHRVNDRFELSLRIAQGMFDEATRVDPTCVRAYLGFAEVSKQLVLSGWTPAKLGWPALRGAVWEALQIQPHCTEALAYDGLYKTLFEWDFPASRESFKSALDLSPLAPSVNEMAGRTMLFQGRFQAAVDHFGLALQYNPMEMSTRGPLIFALAGLGEIAKAKAVIDEVRELDPVSPILKSYGAWLEATHGDPGLGVKWSEEVYPAVRNSSTLAALHAYCLARWGKRSAALAALRSIGDHTRVAAPHSAICSMAWVALDQPDTALRALEAAIAARDCWVGPMLTHPVNQALHALPEFEGLKRAVFSAGPERRDIRRQST